MTPLVFRRLDVGFGRVIVDDHGVTRERLTRRDAIAWEAIRDYRLTIELGSKPDVVSFLFLNGPLMVRDVLRGYRAEHRFRFGMELYGETERVAFNWRFRGIEMAVVEICSRICGPLADAARARLAADAHIQLGPLRLTRDHVQWRDRPPLPRDAVERIELFNSAPISLRVMARDKILPYGRARTAAIPNLVAVLELARTLGYPVGGGELLGGVVGRR